MKADAKIYREAARRIAEREKGGRVWLRSCWSLADAAHDAGVTQEGQCNLVSRFVQGVLGSQFTKQLFSGNSGDSQRSHDIRVLALLFAAAMAEAGDLAIESAPPPASKPAAAADQRAETQATGADPCFNASEQGEHALCRTTEGSGIDAAITPRCSCGWSGYAEHAHNDYMYSNLREQAQAHLDSVGADLIAAWVVP